MLDHEPTGDSTAGDTPAVEPTAATEPPAKATRRRATRRKTADAPPVEASGDPTPPDVAVDVIPDQAATDDAPKAPAKRVRKRATKAAGPAEAAPELTEPALAEAVPAPAETAPELVAEAPPAPAKRTRARKKAAPVVVEPEVIAEPEAIADEDEDAVPAVLSVDELTASVVQAVATAPAPVSGAPAAMFIPPTVMFMPPDPARALVVPAAEPDEAPAKRSRSRRRAAPDSLAPEAAPEAEEPQVATADEDEDDTGPRRRRGRRGRGRGRGGEDSTDEDTTETAAEDEEPAESDEDESEAGTRRRRRRRRRGTSGDGETVDDPPNTVVRVRDAQATARTSFEDEVQGVKGSTRLEAKRQRRRDGRDQGRRRPPVLSEAEFLARREAVERVMVVRQHGERTQIAVLEDDVLVEHYVTKASSASYAGNVYLGKVQNVLPSMEAAFVDIGKGRNAVLYAGEVNWDSAGMEGKPRKIEQALKSGDAVLVQVTKDPIGHKGARLTSQISLPGRFLVYVPEGQMTGISRKLPENERKRLKDVLKKVVPEDAGVIVRTAAEGASEQELGNDVARLEAQWQSIKAKAAKGGAPALLHAEPDLVIRVIRDIFNEDFAKLIVQGNEAWDVVEQYVEHVSPDLMERLHRHTGESDVFADNRVDEQLTKALDRKVWLPSGGSLVIDRTEAMTVVDVNTGKFTGQGGNLEETVTRNNLEAAEEIVRQLRLRDIGGIIVIDFIDMVLEGNRELVLRRLTECLGRDRTKHQVAEVTSLGLVQMTRKRVGQGLLEVFSENCEHCRGRGIVIHTDPVNDRPKPAQPAVVQAAASEPKKRRRGGRGRSGEAETEVEIVAPSPIAVAAAIEAAHAESSDADRPAAVEQAPEILDASWQPFEEPALNGKHISAAEPELVDEPELETVPAAPRRRRRAASRPAGPPAE